MLRPTLALGFALAACGAPDDGWVWQPVEETTCANGRSTGYGLREREGDDLVIYLMGGGACWDAATCYGLGLAWNVSTGYPRELFDGERLRSAAIFDVFPTATQVFVPYCTGDLHSGTTEREHLLGTKTHHKGALNLDAILARQKAPKGRVFVVGTSAGGYGAQLNAERFAQKFPSNAVHVLADSAPRVAPQDKLDHWKEVWGATERTALPEGSRQSLVASRRDWLISSFTGLDPEALEQKILELPGDNLIVEGNQHVFFDDLKNDTVKTWVEAFRDGSSAFH